VPVGALTRREYQVLQLIVDGKSCREIAAELGICFKTVVSHRTRIMEKLDVHETASLVRRAIRKGLVEA
jgi:DNA-binding NarL/FixJ family response regulator